MPPVSTGSAARRTAGAMARRLSRARRDLRAAAASAAAPQLLGASEVELRDIVVIGGAGAVRLARDLAAAAPRARVRLLASRGLSRRQQARLPGSVSVSVCATPHGRKDRLAELPQPQAIVDCAGWGARGRMECFESTFLFLAPGGAYLMPAGSLGTASGDDASEPVAVGELARLLGREPGPSEAELPHRRAELAAAAGEVCVEHGLVVVRKQLLHRYKLRETHADGILAARYGRDWGEVVTTRQAETYRPAVALTLHGGHPDWRGQTAPPSPDDLITVPPLSLRRYAEVQCWSHQRVARENYWLPDTFRHQRDRYLMQRKLVSSSPRHARLPEAYVPAEQASRRLSGSYFYLDSEYPGHFGHVLTELLSRVWGWRDAQRLDPDVRPLLSLSRDMTGLPAFEQRALGALGVDLSRAELITSHESVEVDTLYAATPEFVMPQYASPHLAEVWAAVGSLAAPPAVQPRLLFVARRVKSKRSCVNTEEVEGFFERLGFTKVYPEELAFEEQLGLFQHADVIAGFSGSGLFSMMFAPGKTVIVIRADTFTATNEYLIYSVLGGRLHYFWGEALTRHEPDKWTWSAYQSNFVFNLERFGPEIEAVVREAVG